MVFIHLQVSAIRLSLAICVEVERPCVPRREISCTRPELAVIKKSRTETLHMCRLPTAVLTQMATSSRRLPFYVS